MPTLEYRPQVGDSQQRWTDEGIERQGHEKTV
jgi:hypothetical protein